MPVLAQAHDGFQQFVLCKGAVQRGYAVQLRMFPVRKHDGFRLPFKEECGMHEVDLCRHEVVGIHVGRVVYQLSERREHTDYGIGLRHWVSALRGWSAIRVQPACFVRGWQFQVYVAWLIDF